MLDRVFGLSERRTSVRTEIVAGVTTFMTMAYIIAVNPAILAGTADRPGPLGPGLFAATVTATCLGAAVPCLLMGLWCNYPLALASGMGLNAALAAVVATGGASWQAMMGVVFLEGVIITVLVLTRLREAVMNAIPLDLKRAIGVGIGLFITLLGMNEAHWVRASSSPATPLAMPLGNFHDPRTLLATFGVIVCAWLVARRVRGALLIGIAATTIVAVVFGFATTPSRAMDVPRFSTFGSLDILGALRPALIATIFAFFMSDFFDAMGTIIAVSEQGGFLKPDGSLPRLKAVLLVDGLAATWGGLCSASSVTTYIESASGVGEGGRTGLTSVVVGGLFLLAMLFAPIVQIVPPEATAAALIVVGFLMISVVRDIDFTDYAAAIPAFLIIAVIPLTMSISRGIGTGFIAYVLLRALCGRWRDTTVVMWVLAALFALSFALERA